MGASAAALGLALVGPHNDGAPAVNLPSISIPAKAGSGGGSATSAPSASKKVEKKVIKKVKADKSGYDLELNDEVRAAQLKARDSIKTAKFDRAEASKAESEARKAAEEQAKAALAEKKAAQEARRAEAKERALKLEEERKEKDAQFAKLSSK